MMRALLLVLLFTGPALAGGRGGGGGGGRRGGGGGGHTTVVVRGGGGGGYRGGGGGGRVNRPQTVVRVDRGYGGRPYVRDRYYDHGRRPMVIVENYGRRPGYYWIPGEWQWDGREWIWGQGRYEVETTYPPAPVYVEGGY